MALSATTITANIRRPDPPPTRRSTNPFFAGQRFEPLANFRPDLLNAPRDPATTERHDFLLEEHNEPLGAFTPSGFVSSPSSRTVCHVSSPQPTDRNRRRFQNRWCRLLAAVLHRTAARRTIPTLSETPNECCANRLRSDANSGRARMSHRHLIGPPLVLQQRTPCERASCAFSWKD